MWINSKKIVHLDDHRLFTTGARIAIQPNFPEVEYIPFSNTDEAFHFIIKCLLNSEKIDLLITDLNHPGLSGYEFVKAIRSIEKSIGGMEGGAYVNPTIS